MKLRKIMTEPEDGIDIAIYAACEDDGSIICHDSYADFSDILDSDGFKSAINQLFYPEIRPQLSTKEGLCQNKYTLLIRTKHALNNAPSEFPL